jgi:hypothetical protein
MNSAVQTLSAETVCRVNALIRQHRQANEPLRFAMELEQQVKLSLLQFDYEEVAVLSLALAEILK